MMKILIFALVFTLSFMQAKNPEQNSTKSDESAQISSLQSKQHWEQILNGKDLKFGYYDKAILITFIDKTAKSLELFYYDNGVLTSKFSNQVITGLMGEKLKEGDLKTPVGAYIITRHFKPSDPYLGPVAFSLNYPNLYDILRKRTGSGIWIHGYPMNGERTDTLKTRACVALENDRLFEYEKIVNDNAGVVIISQKGAPNANKAQIASILAEIFAWQKAWQNNDIKAYLSFYDKNFKFYNGQNYKAFAKKKRAIFAKKEQKSITFTDFSITPYPSSDKGELFRVSFNENYKTKSHKFKGKKILYLRLNADKIKILTEK